MKVEIEKQKAYIGKLPNGGMITKNLYSEFNDADTPTQAIVDVDRQIMEYNCNEGKKYNLWFSLQFIQPTCQMI